MTNVLVCVCVNLYAGVNVTRILSVALKFIVVSRVG